MPKTINVNSLNPDATYLVRGKVGFSRITRPTTDAERAEANKRRSHPIDKNYTHISLYDARVIAHDPQNPTIEERYAAECLYKSSSTNYPGNNFSAMNKSRNLPRVGVIDPDAGANHFKEIVPEHELAVGLDVTLVMRVFKGSGNNGVSLDRVLVNEPIRYYISNSPVDKALADAGIVFTAMAPSAAPVSDTPADTDTPAFAPVPAAAAAPAGDAQPVAPAATDNPFSSYASAAPAAPAATPAATGNMTFGPGNRQY